MCIKSDGVDAVSTKIHRVVDYLVGPLSLVLNNSLVAKVSPNDLKLAYYYSLLK